MSNYTRYLLASAGVEVTDELVTSIEEIAREASPIGEMHSLTVIEVAVQVIAAYGVAEQFKASMKLLEAQAGQSAEGLDGVSQALLHMATQGDQEEE